MAVHNHARMTDSVDVVAANDRIVLCSQHLDIVAKPSRPGKAGLQTQLTDKAN